MTATDGEMVGQFVVPREEDAEGSISAMVPAAQLATLLGKIQAEDLNLHTLTHTLVVSAGPGEFQVTGQDVEEFPDVLLDVPPHVATIRSESLARALRRALFAAAKEQTRYAINGVRIEIEGDKVRAVATDGRRLSVAEIECNGLAKVAGVVPSKCALGLVRALEKSAGESVVVHMDQRRLVVRSDGVSISTVLFEDRFPAWQQVIPSRSNTTAKFDRADLLSVVDRVAVQSSQDVPMVVLTMEGEQLQVRSQSESAGRAEEWLNGCLVEGDQAEVSVNPGYLIDALKVSEHESAIVSIGDPSGPMLWELGGGWRYILMPVTSS